MNPKLFRHRWLTLLNCHKDLQPEELLRPIQEKTVDDVLIFSYEHTARSGWAVALSPQGTLVKAYDMDEISEYTFADVRPHYKLPEWALQIYNDPAWTQEKTISFRLAEYSTKDWEEPWLALAWLPIEAHNLVEPTDSAITFWAQWFGRGDLAPLWINLMSGQKVT